ncbi:S-layer homology domain-containing protein [Tumebacillus permanentifrigoris]|uniref:S-layer family protein n=1 Tax=Tumebacillus permanentifrigoris TaxID=378543 RepID=A0A316D5Z1_9BACL|nr:S-layer homology domain-containing protein [Tumebacillus permanentifrigoris]PWK06988.1 S-layer family protein [Tumebacillus permanentifrigoris]
MNNRKCTALLTAAVLLGSTVVPLAIPAPASAAVQQLTAPLNVQLNPDRSVLWLPVVNNNGYLVYVYDAATNAIIGAFNAPTNSSSLKLDGLITLNGTYFVKVTTRGDNLNTLDSPQSTASNRLTVSSSISLSPPSTPSLDAKGFAKWDNVLNNGYLVNLYHSPSNTLVTSQLLPKDVNQLDLTGIVPGTGVYYYKVIAKGNSQMTDSGESPASTAMSLSFSRLATPHTPALSDERIATWANVPNNNGYRISIYNADNDTIVGFAQASKDTVSYDLSALIKVDGNYYIRLQALGTGLNSSEDSPRSDTQTYYLDGSILFIKPDKLTLTSDLTADIPTTTVTMKTDDLLFDLTRKSTAYNLLAKVEVNQGRMLLNVPGSVLEKVSSRSNDSTLRVESGLGSVTLSVAEMKELAKNSGVFLADSTVQVELGQTAKVKPSDQEMIPLLLDVRLLDKQSKTLSTLTETHGYLSLTTPFSKDSFVDLTTLAGVRLTDKFTTTPIPTSFKANSDQSYGVTFHYQGTGTFGIVKKELHFPDVSTTHYAKRSIETLASKMVISGFEDGTFHPNETVTRAQFATMLVKTLGLKDKSQLGAAPTFTDVAKDSWYMNYVETAYRSNLISGMGDGRFAPEDKITAQDMSMMVARALKYANPTLPALTEGAKGTAMSKLERRAEVASYATDAVALCVNQNILIGMTINSFSPTVASDRAMAADMLYQLLKALNFSN